MSKYNWDISKIREVVKRCVNFSEVLEQLGIPRLGNNSSTLRQILDLNNIDYSHFIGRARSYSKANTTKIEDYLNNSVKIASSKLREKLIKEGIKENRCEKCGILEWQGLPIVCQLHHIDGNHLNNHLENLQILCPNCHSLTDNFCGLSNKNIKHYYCPDCGREINSKSKYCSVCSAKHLRKVERPSRNKLISDFSELQSFSSVGRKYNVTDNTIRKWFLYYNLPDKSKELKNYIKTHIECSDIDN